LIDLPPLDSLNQSKEWLLFCCKAIAVFETNKRLSRSQSQYIDYLKHLNQKFAGWVLNKAVVRNYSKKSNN
jgi:Mrp family chromosome partitioning ATPase